MKVVEKYIIENWVPDTFQHTSPYIVRSAGCNFYTSHFNTANFGSDYMLHNSLKAAKQFIRSEHSIAGKTPRFKWKRIV